MPSCDECPPPSCDEHPPPLDRWPPHSMGRLLTQQTVASLNEWPGSCCSTNSLVAQQMLSLLNEQSLPIDLLHGLPPLINGLGLPPTLTNSLLGLPPTSPNGLLGLPPTSVNGLLSLPLTPQMVSTLLQQMASSLDEWPPLLIQRCCSRFTFRT